MQVSMLAAASMISRPSSSFSKCSFKIRISSRFRSIGILFLSKSFSKALPADRIAFRSKSSLVFEMISSNGDPEIVANFDRIW